VALPTSKPPGKGASALQDPRALEEAQRQDRHRTEELADTCGSVEEDLEALKARFEMYFLGIERREPAREREEIKRRVSKLKGEFTRNTGLRFRIQTLHARFLSYERMWLRSAREKEEGTYRRDLLRARRHAARQEEKRRRDEEAAAREKGAAPVAPAADARSAAAPAAAPPAAPPAAPAPAAAPRPAEIPEAQLRALFAAYVEAKRRCNEDVSRLTYEALARTVAKQVPELLAKHKATRVEFRVVVKDGRAVLKAVPRM
jgi:hypothetical protein